MKWFNTSIFRVVLYICVPAAAITYLYSAGQGRRSSVFASRANHSQVHRPYSKCELTCPLPGGWRADRKDGKLWLTHYNLDRSIADSLFFNCVEDLYAWVEAHPDCCDVDVDKLVSEALRDAPPVSAIELTE